MLEFTMKKIYFIIIFNCFIALQFLAQTNVPADFNIQFSMRRANGTAASNKGIRVQTLIFAGTSNLVYSKVFTNLQTNAYGILSLNVSGIDNTNRSLPSAETFATNEMFLQFKVDTIDVASVSDIGLFEVYTKQKFTSVPYAMAAKKAPGTFVYFDTPTDSVLNNNRGIDGDAALEISPTQSNAFPKFYFNKKNNAWPNAAYSLLPNNASNIFKTIFYNQSGPSSNVKQAWEINNALTLNQKGIGINVPTFASPTKALEVYGTLRFDTLKNLTGGNRMVAADQSGNVFTLPIPSIVGIPSGNQQGDILYYDLTSNTWVPTSLLQFKNNSFSVARNIEVTDTMKTNVAVFNSSVFLNSLKNNLVLDTAIYLSTNANGRLVARRMNNFAWSIRGNNLTTFGNIPFIGSTDASDLVFKTNSSQTMRMYGQAFGTTRLAGDIDINNSLYVLKDLSVVDNIKLEANKYKNPSPLDSIRFLSTDANGNINLHKVKFPAIVGLPNGNVNGDMLYYGGASGWLTTSFLQFKNSSLFISKNANIGDSLSTKYAVVSDDLFLNSLKNNILTDTNLFLKTNANGKVVLAKFGNQLWGLQGNAISTLPNQPFIGTTDAADLNFKTNSVLSLKIFGNNTIPNRLNGDVEFSKSVFIAKDLNVSTNVKFEAINYLNPQPLDSTRFLTTDGNGNLILHKVKFPTTSGTLPAGTSGDLFFFNNSTWAANSNVKITSAGSLFANQNISANDSLLADIVKVKNDVILSSLPNPIFADSSHFLTTDLNGKIVLQKVKIPTTTSTSSVVSSKFIQVTAPNQTFIANDTTRIFIAHNTVNSGAYGLNLPLASSTPNRSYEVFFGRPSSGLKPNLQVISSSGFSDIYSFKTYTTINTFTETTNNSIKVTITSTFINTILGYKWILVTDDLN